MGWILIIGAIFLVSLIAAIVCDYHCLDVVAGISLLFAVLTFVALLCMGGSLINKEARFDAFVKDYEATKALVENYRGTDYGNMQALTEKVIFENGQGLLLCDTGKDTYDTTPSNTGIEYALDILNEIGAQPEDITAHYVTRPYLTRHGDGNLTDESSRSRISSAVGEDRTNHFNDGQGEFRYGTLDIGSLKDRIVRDARGINFELEVTHCDEMDRIAEFKKSFGKVNVYDSALIR